MARDATVALEELIALLFLGRNCVALTAQTSIEAGVGSHERTFEGRKRVEKLDACRIDYEDCGEVLSVVRILPQLCKEIVPVRVHDARIAQNRFVLLLERAKIALPVQACVARHVENGGRVEIERPAIVSERSNTAIRAS